MFEMEEKQKGLHKTSIPQKQENRAAKRFSSSELPPSMRVRLEGDDFSSNLPPSFAGTNVYKNSPEPQKYGADAFTKGSSIFLSRGAESLLGHELGHVIQQAEGRIHATDNICGQPVNDDRALEKEADMLGNQLPGSLKTKVLAESREVAISAGEIGGIVQCGKTRDAILDGDVKKLYDRAEAEKKPYVSKFKAGSKKAQEDIAHHKAEVEAEQAPRRLNVSTYLFSYQNMDSADVQNKGSKDGILMPKLTEDEVTAGIGEPVVNEKLETALGRKIEKGELAPINEKLRAHLFHGEAAVGMTTGPTGLHAYSDYSYTEKAGGGGQQVKGLAGGLPEGVIPLGFIGDRTRVHILYWERGGKKKFSTMMPVNMPERVSASMFSMVESQKRENLFEENKYLIKKKGDSPTMFPVNDTDKVEVTSKEMAGQGLKLPTGITATEDTMTISGLFQILDSNSQNEPAMIKFLTDKNIYKKLN